MTEAKSIASAPVESAKPIPCEGDEFANGGEYRSATNGKVKFQPTKPENLVRPQGVKPPPPRKTK